jgi:hypothetical protein
LELKGEVDATAEAVVQRITDTVVEVRTRSSVASFLVLSDVFYPGWSVTIDGVPSRLYQTNFVLRGALVPAGLHTVRFEFTPRAFYAGLGVTVLASVITISLPIFGMLRGRGMKRAPKRARMNREQTANACRLLTSRSVDGEDRG